LPPPPELELDDDPPPLPPPPDDELDDDPPPLDDELDADDDELDEAALELEEAALELEAVLELDPCPAVEDEVPGTLEEDSPEDGSVTPVPQAVASMPTPASAAPPDSTRRNCRRSSRRASASVANLLDSFIGSLLREAERARAVPAGLYSGGSAPPS
jgi:hypothetical protein